MLLAELEVRHSRAVAPTRRVALGSLWLPTDPAPGFGGLLLAGIVGGFAPRLDDELRDELDGLVHDLQAGRRIAQPRLRHRFQSDTVGLDRSRHRLVGDGERVQFELDDHGAPLPQVLGALYAASLLSYRARPDVFRLVRRATRWEGEADDRLAGYLTGDEAGLGGWRTGRDESWALRLLGFGGGDVPTRSDVLRRFRKLVREVHPDHGAQAEGAGERIHQLTEARRILLTPGA